MDRGRRKFASPRKKTAVSDHQISPSLILRPNDPFAPRAIVQATWGPVQRLGHPAGRVVDLGQHDLAGIVEARPDLHRPDALTVLERRLSLRPSAGYRSSQAAIFGSARARSSAASCVMRGSTGAGTNGVSMSRPSESYTGEVAACAEAPAAPSSESPSAAAATR